MSDSSLLSVAIALLLLLFYLVNAQFGDLRALKKTLYFPLPSLCPVVN